MKAISSALAERLSRVVPKTKITNQRQEVNKMFLVRLNAAREGVIDKKTGKPYKPLTAGFVASRMAPMTVGQLRQFYGYCDEAKNFSSTWWWATNPKNYPDKLQVEIAPMVDDSTVEVTIPTPEGWKCDRCLDPYYHEHGTYTLDRKQ